MPRVTITRTSPNLSGTELIKVPADDVNGMQFQNNGNQILCVDNGGAAAVNVTIDMAPDKFGRDGSKIVAVPAGGQRFIGPFLPDQFNQGGFVYVDLSADTDVLVGVLSLQS